MYVVANASKVSMKEIFKAMLYFIPAYLVAIVIYMIFPQIITWMPSLL